jgi:hypothetical protein
MRGGGGKLTKIEREGQPCLGVGEDVGAVDRRRRADMAAVTMTTTDGWDEDEDVEER